MGWWRVGAGLWSAAALGGAVLAIGCGRTPLLVPPQADAGPGASAEVCNGLDDDLDGKVDETFRDPDGLYVDDAHCGACGRACDGDVANATAMHCTLLGGVPACAATECRSGFGPSGSGGCSPLDDHLCLACSGRGGCGTLASAQCAMIAGETRCTRGCEGGCPSGYRCGPTGLCVPVGGSCSCSAGGPDFTLACRLTDDAASCPGRARCEMGALTECIAPDEVCDAVDNDCDGLADEGFVDARGAYSLDDENCGACGIDCGVDGMGSGGAPVRLACGGDPFAPSCVTDCPDAENGVQLGDRLDADRELDNGCECIVTSLTDASGAPTAEAGQLDSNCDGADGDVLSSFYVATDGDDSGPGSPTRPLRTIGAGIARAAESLSTGTRRPHVYVASGIYTESLRMRDGVQLHGGYRNDFRAQPPSGFDVIVVAPADTEAPFGAALVLQNVGNQMTLVEGLQLRGRDAIEPGAAAVAVFVENAHSLLTLRALRVVAGRPGPGANGQDGAAGRVPMSTATDGQPPRAAREDAVHACASGVDNRVNGGAGGRNQCMGTDVSGGDGGAVGCPVYASNAASGRDASSASTDSGRGGVGGTHIAGPIAMGSSCTQEVCCGLADFEVPTQFVQSAAGLAGRDGESGQPGLGCEDSFGAFESSNVFAAGAGRAGSRGSPGLGGGGGGGGGGAEIAWTAGLCEFADGLGGGGGGGGAGGCGGSAGSPGQSGGPSIGILIWSRLPRALPVLEALEISTAEGGRGGDGGAGGDGATGGQGGFGGHVPEAQRSTPTLAGPMSGERGGKGGNGGGGGGGGGGCGGASVGVWLAGLGARTELVEQFERGNTFALGAGGVKGRGGSGWMAAGDGAEGSRASVVVR